MNRFVRKSFGDDDDDEEKLCERQALIVDDDQVNLLPSGIRQRQQADKNRYDKLVGHELKNLNKAKDLISEPVIEFTYYDIQHGDSLQSICLRFACSVNQVKRLNGLITDTEFYGLRRLKLPLGKLGLLEDLLKGQQEQQQQVRSLVDATTNHSYSNHLTSPHRNIVNSPGTALSVSIRDQNPRFRPLLSPGFSSDRINELNKIQQNDEAENSNGLSSTRAHHNSHSFSSLRDFVGNDTSIDLYGYPDYSLTSIHNNQASKHLQQQNFIKSNYDDDGQVAVDDLIGSGTTVQSVFEDLDYYVERAKAAAETYDQRASELVGQINVDDSSTHSWTSSARPRVSRIPELFFSGENFGMNFKKLIILIIVVCLVIPLIYLNQANVVHL